jgi:hypothetical protein
MQFEAADAAEITKLVDYVDENEDPPIQAVRTHKYKFESAMLQTARPLKKIQRETRKIKGIIADKTKERWQ